MKVDTKESETPVEKLTNALYQINETLRRINENLYFIEQHLAPFSAEKVPPRLKLVEMQIQELYRVVNREKLPFEPLDD